LRTPALCLFCFASSFADVACLCLICFSGSERCRSIGGILLVLSIVWGQVVELALGEFRWDGVFNLFLLVCLLEGSDPRRTRHTIRVTPLG